MRNPKHPITANTQVKLKRLIRLGASDTSFIEAHLQANSHPVIITLIMISSVNTDFLNILKNAGKAFFFTGLQSVFFRQFLQDFLFPVAEAMHPLLIDFV